MDLKFYFCESCGKRLTNVDLEAGQAKDKKIKGVYCVSCSVGVSTMDLAPLTDEEAQQAVARGAASIEIAISPRKIHAKNLDRHASSDDHTAQPKSRVGLVVSAAAVVLLVAIVVVMIGRSRPAPEQTLAANTPTASQTVAKPSVQAGSPAPVALEP